MRKTYEALKPDNFKQHSEKEESKEPIPDTQMNDEYIDMTNKMRKSKRNKTPTESL